MAGRVGAPIFMKYFGKLPGQKLSEFAEELKKLTDADYEQLRAGIENGSLTY